MKKPSSLLILRPIEENDLAWIRSFLTERWGSTMIVSRGRTHQADELPGIIALHRGTPVGLVTYAIEGDACELVTLDSQLQGAGIGPRLIEEVARIVGQAGCNRLWLVTTNDNQRAIGFYRKQGFTLSAIHAGAIRQARSLKPEIPLIGHDGVPIEDEWEFEREL